MLTLASGLALSSVAAGSVATECSSKGFWSWLTGSNSEPAADPSAWTPGVKRRPVKKNFISGGRKAQRGLILHVQEGQGSLFEWFSNPSAKVSAHFWVSQTGEIEQYVSAHDQAWAQRDGNAEWASVETSGFAAQPLTPAQVEAVARIYQWGAREHGWALKLADHPQDTGLGTHAMGGSGWGLHECPGPSRSAQREAIMARVLADRHSGES
ncbi:peptidoglycan recognition family protein [Streptomyces klenkii]|uniref:peptidoglycan recognition protein family protein n=1 Tax=Streptomyces klenkii TaxID=1420899 RepID=UPI0033B48D07